MPRKTYSDFNCPECSDTLNTDVGLKRHHTTKHGESLPNRVCSQCEADFYDENASRDLCPNCLPDGDMTGENNPNWKGGKQHANCANCGEGFKYYPSDKSGIYCEDCAHLTQVVNLEKGWDPESKYKSIEESTWKHTVNCAICGTEVVRTTMELETRDGFLCSDECKSLYYSELYKGDKHPNWKGGHSCKNYSGSWRSVRADVRELDNHTCQLCGDTAEDLGQEPSAHHIIPVCTFDNEEEAHYIENCILLCPSCHTGVDWGIKEVDSEIVERPIEPPPDYPVGEHYRASPDYSGLEE